MLKIKKYLLYYSAGLTLFRVETKLKLFKKNLSRPLFVCVHFYRKDELACELEGVRVTMEVMVHLCSQQTRNLGAENPSDLNEIKGDLVKHSIWQFGKLTKVSFTFEKY